MNKQRNLLFEAIAIQDKRKVEYVEDDGKCRCGDRKMICSNCPPTRVERVRAIAMKKDPNRYVVTAKTAAVTKTQRKKMMRELKIQLQKTTGRKVTNGDVLALMNKTAARLQAMDQPQLPLKQE